MIELCPTHGDFITTCIAPVHITQHHQVHAEFQTEIELSIPANIVIVPIKILIERLELASVELRRASPHERRTTLIGVRSDAVSGLQVVVARRIGKQPRLDQTAEEETQQEVKLAQESMVRLNTLAKRIRAGTANAEDVISVVRCEHDKGRAREALYQLLTRKQTLEIGGQELVRRTPEVSQSDLQIAASRAYRLKMTIVSLNMDLGEVDCRLVAGDEIGSIFENVDLEHRILHIRAFGETLFILTQVASFGLSFEADISIKLSITPKGLSYRCSLIQLVDAANLTQKLREKQHQMFEQIEGS